MDKNDYRCPCCMKYIYINYACPNKHNVCGDCWIKTDKCPICRDPKRIQTETNPSVPRKKCKNSECTINLYQFDDEHEKECQYNKFICKFCNNTINDSPPSSEVESHFNFCANNFITIKCPLTDKVNIAEEFKINIKPQPTLITIEDHYHMIIIPKPLQQKINFIVFSTKKKYRLSNYKIKIILPNRIHETPIYYKKMIDSNITYNFDDTISFTIQNMFVINKAPTEQKMGNTYYFEEIRYKGEPGSAGNWTHDDYEKLLKEFSGTK